MRYQRAGLLLGLAGGGFVAPAWAQGVVEGAEVRARVCAEASEDDACRWIRGSVVALGGGSLTVRDASGVETPVPWTPATRVRVLSGRRRNTGIGLVGGALAGLLVGALAEGECSEMCGIYPLLGIGGGAILGGAIGYAMTSDRWVAVDPPRGAALTLRGRRVGVSIAF
jgi:hypothetical protein